MTYDVQLTEPAEGDLLDITDNRIREAIVKGLARLDNEPAKRGKPLTGNLSGFFAVRVAKQRYRAIFHVDEAQLVVRVIAVGIRREGDRQDVYEVARKRASE